MTKRLIAFYLFVFLSQVNQAQLVCAFTASDTSGCAPLVVTFTDNSSGNAIGWYWNFGNGDTSTQKNPIEAFNDTGTFNVLHVVSNGVIYDTASVIIRVNARANALFSPSATFSNCPPFPVQFSQVTTDTTYAFWNFGDGDTSQVISPFHIYIYPGNYSVSLYVRNKYGCVADTTLTNLIQIKGPVGNFTASVDSGCLPLLVHFSGITQSTATSIFSPAPGIIISNRINATCLYPQAGAYCPVYTLTDSFGCTIPYPLDTIYVNNCNPAGIEPLTRLSANSITIQPNPAFDDFIVETDVAGNYEISFISAEGKVIEYSQTTQKRVIQAAGMASGVYFLRVKDLNTGNIATKRVIIQH